MIRLVVYILLWLCFFAARADIPKDPVAKYTFNKGNLKSEVGATQAVISEAVLTEDRFGNPRSAYYLFGNLTSYINLGTSPVLKPRHGSISIWFNIEKPIYKGKGYDENPIILTKNRQGDDFFEGYAMAYEFSVKKISVSLAIDSTNQTSFNSKEVVQLNEWHHAVLAYDDHHLWVYLDGILENDNRPLKKHFVSVFSPTDSVMVGNSANKKNARFFAGYVDDIYIYDRVLTAREVEALYHEPDYNRTNFYIKIAVWVGVALAVMALIIWLLLLRYRREMRRQKERNQIQARLNEVETKAIRMQMNPHFVFNSLNTLQHFILEEDFQKSNLYLSKFSGLLRQLLESSMSDFISLSEEMEILNSYIEIESMRFDNSFKYEIRAEIPQPDQVYIPFMLVQPFLENAIWHGLLPKKGDRFVSVRFSEHDHNRILCEIEDNGLGRQNALVSSSPFKKKSLGVNFIRQRLELLEKSTGIACGLEIIDKRDEEGRVQGTKVNVLIPKLSYENTYNHY